MKKSILLCLMLVLQGVLLYGQDAAADLKRISAFYREHLSYSQKMEYRTYKNYTDKTAFDVQQGEIIKKGDLLYIKQGAVEQIRNRNYTLSVNHSKKTIVLLQRKVSGTFDFSKVNYDTLLTFCKSVTYHPLGNGKASYTLEFRAEEYEKITLVFDTKTYCITAVEYLLAPRIIQDDKGNAVSYKSRMTIQYSDFKAEVSLPDDYFTYKRYLIKQQANRYICTQAFRNYSFANQSMLNY